MKWSPEQDRALQAIDKWARDPGSPQVFKLFGYAGTGKTTLAKTIAEGIDGRVLFGAYTGKAAHVLRGKGCPNADTIHSMIYHSRDQSALRLKQLELSLLEFKQEIAAEHAPEDRNSIDWGQYKQYNELCREIDAERMNCSKPMFSLNFESEVKYANLVIIDECSMVDTTMADDLLFFGTKVLVLGDPGQLPPVMGTGYFIQGEPDFMLQEIHRQARDNPIIAMASHVREGGALKVGEWGENQIIPVEELKQHGHIMTEADQILVGRNNTRRDYNKRMRQVLGRSASWDKWQPVAQDKLVCLRNNKELGLLNGAQWEVTSVLSFTEDRVNMQLRSLDTQALLDVEGHTHHFMGKTEAMPWWERKEAEEFDYGYVMTTHKAQGSQWDKVVVFDESFVFREDRSKWLYTAITRAAQQLHIVKM
jgi:exodeoxyribonuclease-5